MPDDSSAQHDPSSGTEPTSATDPAAHDALPDARPRRRWVLVGGVLVALVGLVAAGIWYQSSRTSGDTADDPVEPDRVTAAPLAEGMSFGRSGGPIVDVYVDYQCIHCADLEQVIGPELVRMTAGGEAVVVIRPVKFQSRASGRGAAALYCAAGTGDAFAMHQLLLDDISADFSPEGLTATAGSMGLDPATFGACLTDGATTSWVNGVTDTARSDGISGIPAVFVDGTRLSDVQLASGLAFRDAVLASGAEG